MLLTATSVFVGMDMKGVEVNVFYRVLKKQLKQLRPIMKTLTAKKVQSSAHNIALMLQLMINVFVGTDTDNKEVNALWILLQKSNHLIMKTLTITKLQNSAHNIALMLQLMINVFVGTDTDNKEINVFGILLQKSHHLIMKTLTTKKVQNSAHNIVLMLQLMINVFAGMGTNGKETNAFSKILLNHIIQLQM